MAIEVNSCESVSAFIPEVTSGCSDCDNSTSITEVEDGGGCGAEAAVVSTPTESVSIVDIARLGEVRETEAGVRVVSEDALAMGVIGDVVEAVQVVSDIAAAMES